MTKYHKETFDNIPEEKREKIFRTAMKEFSKNGLVGTKVGDIAKQAGISHGSMYSYFPTKDALINTVILKGYELQRNGLQENWPTKGTIFDHLDSILTYAQQLAKNEPEMVAVWCEMSFEFNARFSRLVIKMEEEGLMFWKKFIEEGINEGSLSSELDHDAAAFIIDSTVGTLMRGYISKHEQTKLSIHFENAMENDEKIIKSLVESLKRMLKP